MEFYLVSTDHLSDALWFKDDEDFKAGMNQVAVVTNLTGICVLAFTLMSNHVHFVLQSTREDAVTFINRYKQAYAYYCRKRYGEKKFLRRNAVDYQRLEANGESLERGLAYTQMNPVAANICSHPSGYRWGTGDVFFRDRPARGRCLGSLSLREQARILHSRIRLNPDWILSEEGYILPESYVPTSFVENLFRTPSRFNYFLNNSSKAKARMSQRELTLPSFRDQTIISALPDLCRGLFHVNNINLLGEEQMAELSRQLRFRFSADIHQIARILGKPYSEIVRLLNAL